MDTVALPLDRYTLWAVQRFEETEAREEAVARSAAAFRVAHAVGGSALWMVGSGPDDQRISWLLGSEAERGQPDDQLLLPAGASGGIVPSDPMARRLKSLDRWTKLEAVLGARYDREQPDAPAFSDELRDAVLARLAHYPFFIVAQLRPAAVNRVLQELSDADNKSRFGRADSRANYASAELGAELAGDRAVDLREALDLGGWRAELSVGTTVECEQAVVALACTALSIPGLSFRSENDPSAPDRSPASLMRPTTDVVLSNRQLARISRPPQRELPGIVLGPAMPYDINPESPDGLPPAEVGEGDGAAAEPREQAVDLGATLDATLAPAARFDIPLATLNRHAFISGATGSGKTQTAKHLLTELTTLGVPWLVIEPAKSEYRAMVERLTAAGIDAGVEVIRIGDPLAPPLSINPLEPEPGFPLQTHVDMVAALFMASFDAEEPFPQILNAALRRCYTELGWELATGTYKTTRYPIDGDPTQRHPRYPTLADLQRAATNIIEEIGYADEIRRNMLGYVGVRLNSLRIGTPGRFFENGHPLDLESVLSRNVVIEIEDVGNDVDKAFVIGAVIMRLYEHLRAQARSASGERADGALHHVTLVEEAHRLLRRNEPGVKPNQAVELFGAMLSEVRAFGEGIVIAEQIPTKILSDVVKNTAVQIIHRLPSAEDRHILAGATNMDDDQSDYVVSLRPGQAAAFREGMDAPVLLQVDPPPLRPPAATSSPAATDYAGLIARSHSLICGAASLREPCDGVRLAAVDTHLAATPTLGLYAELCFLSLISGRPTPEPRQAWIDEINHDLPPDIRHCLIATLVEETVSSRWAQLADFYDPRLLHDPLYVAIDEMRSVNREGFEAGRFLAAAIERSLASHDIAHQSRRPMLDRIRRRGITLPDGDVFTAIEWVRRSSLSTYRDQSRLVAGRTHIGVDDARSRLGDFAELCVGSDVEGDAIRLAQRSITDQRLDLDEWFADYG
ncbi:MAG: ATP-binding protein [Actinomycetota bacterium]